MVATQITKLKEQCTDAWHASSKYPLWHTKTYSVYARSCLMDSTFCYTFTVTCSVHEKRSLGSAWLPTCIYARSIVDVWSLFMKSANKPAAFAREPKSVFREKERNSQNNMPYVQLRFLLIPQNSEKPPLRNSWFLRNLSDPPEKGKKKRKNFRHWRKKTQLDVAFLSQLGKPE